MAPIRQGYFKTSNGTLAPLVVSVERQVAFNEVDIMGIVWHGRYAEYFEQSSAELRSRAGLSHHALFDAALRAPIVKFHVEYQKPLLLDERVRIESRLLWTEAARMDIEYTIYKQDGRVAATGYTVQLFTDAESGEPCFASPALWERCRERWQGGELDHLK